MSRARIAMLVAFGAIAFALIAAAAIRDGRLFFVAAIGAAAAAVIWGKRMPLK